MAHSIATTLPIASATAATSAQLGHTTYALRWRRDLACLPPAHGATHEAKGGLHGGRGGFARDAATLLGEGRSFEGTPRRSRVARTIRGIAGTQPAHGKLQPARVAAATPLLPVAPAGAARAAAPSSKYALQTLKHAGHRRTGCYLLRRGPRGHVRGSAHQPTMRRGLACRSDESGEGPH